MYHFRLKSLTSRPSLKRFPLSLPPPIPVLPTSRNTPSPIDPETIQVPVGYEPDPADLALSSVPGQEVFDPRKRKFSAEELKPQPMIKKARKVFIPEDMKVRATATLLLPSPTAIPSVNSELAALLN